MCLNICIYLICQMFVIGEKFGLQAEQFSTSTFYCNRWRDLSRLINTDLFCAINIDIFQILSICIEEPYSEIVPQLEFFIWTFVLWETMPLYLLVFLVSCPRPNFYEPTIKFLFSCCDAHWPVGVARTLNIFQNTHKQNV